MIALCTTPGRRALTALALLVVLFAAACGSDHTLIVTVIGVDASIKTLRLQGDLDAYPLPLPAEVSARIITFHVPLSAGLTGRATLRVTGHGEDTCTTAAGLAITDIPPDGPVSLDVFLKPRAIAACPVVVEKVGGGTGEVRSSDGMLSCGSQCTAYFDRGTPLNLSLALGDQAHFVGWSGACSGTTACALTVTGPVAIKAHLVSAASCSPGSFCWQSPRPQGHTIRALWSAAATDQWAVGDQGLTMHWDGRSWASLPSPVTRGLHGLWSSRPDDLWAVNESGTLLHYDGTTWQSLTTVTDRWLHAVWGSSSTNVWAVGDEGTILHFDGINWLASTLPTNASLYAVWGTAATDVWAAGYGGLTWHFDGTQWVSVRIATNLLVNALWGTGPGDVWAVGQDFTANAGAIWHYNGQSWARYYTTPGPRLSALWGNTPTDLWTVGESGTISLRNLLNPSVAVL